MANVKNIENCNEVREPLTIEEEDCKGDENKKRGNWSKQMEFTLSMVGYSVGFGNLWRFPYLFTRNGGVAFMVPFLLFLLLCGLPLFYLEVIIGQFSSLSPPKVWKMCPLFQGIGYSSAFLSGVVCIHFAVINSWAIYFTAISCQKVLPWSYCDNEWNSDTCTSPFQRWDTEMNQTNASFAMSMIRNVSVEPVTESALTVATETSPPSLREQMFGKHLSSSAEFWEFHVLDTSSGFGDFGSIRWQLTVALAVGWIMVFLSHIRGVKSLGKVVYFTALMPYLLLTVFFVRCLMLPGGLDGLLYFFKPSFHKLLEIKVWAEALLQVFYSLGPGWGGLITMASYNKFNHDCYRDALIVTVTDSATCLYGGMVMYSALGFMSYSANMHISQLTAFGPGLLFIVYPEICLHLPASPIWAFLFFFMLITLGMDSQFGMFETLVSGLVDTFPSTLQKRKCLVALVIAVSCFLMGIIFVTQGGIFLLQISDWYIPAFTPVVIACVECIIVVWIYGCDRISSEIKVMVGKKPSTLIRTCWCIVTPLLMMITLIFVLTNYKSPSYGNYQYPESAQTFGWILATASLFPLLGLMIWRLLKAKGAPKQRLCQLVQPAPDWGPALEKHRALCPQTNWSYDGGFVKRLKKNIFN